MSAFIEELEGLLKKDAKGRATLRRSLSFEPGTYPPAFPYVERFIKAEGHLRNMHYLVAGLWASHWHAERTGIGQSIGEAAARHQFASHSGSVEGRFIALLDADADQLCHRLRQMVTLLKDQPLDFAALLEDLIHWNNPAKRTQNRWARGFYRAQDPAAPLPNLNPAAEALS